MNFTNKLALALTAIFVVSLLLLSSQILYLLWRKRRPRPVPADVEFGSGGEDRSAPPPKGVLRFLCWKNYYQTSRVEPSVANETVAAEDEVDEEFEEMVKLHQLFSPSSSRALFTIKEESEMEGENGGLEENGAVEVEDGLSLTATVTEVVVIEVDDEEEEEDEMTAFKTPCASPPYYTPPPSPPRDETGEKRPLGK